VCLYIFADGWDPSPFRYFAKKYAEALGWVVIKLPSGHDVTVDLPNELAAALQPSPKWRNEQGERSFLGRGGRANDIRLRIRLLMQSA
jgi:hypothetical protein